MRDPGSKPLEGATIFLLETLEEVSSDAAGRSAKAVERVRQRLGSATATHLVVRHLGKLIPVSVEEISRISADDDLVQLHVRGRAPP